MKQRSSRSEKGTMRRILRLLKPYWALVTLTILLSATTVAGSLYVPVCVGRAIDRMLGPGAVELPAVLSFLNRIGIVVLASALCQWLAGVINNRITYFVVKDIRIRAFIHLQKLPFAFLDNQPVGGIVSRVITDVDQFADGLLLGFTQLFTGIVTILGTLAFMLAIRPTIALVVVILTPLSFLAAKYIASHTHQYFVEQSRTRGEQTAFIDEYLGNQKIVKTFGREEASVSDFDRINDHLGKCSLQAIFFSSLTNPVTRFVNSLVYAAVVLSGALLCISTAGTASAFTVGSLSALLTYANQYTKPFNEISSVVTEFQNALACAGRIFSLMEEPTELPDREDAVMLQHAVGGVRLEGVCFSYVKERPLIENLNLEVHPGQRVAIVGPTGCGKTTLINLLMRFYDVDRGMISVDGISLKDMTRSSLRENYGMVLQETWLRSGTILENVAMGRPSATREEVVEACRQAHAHSFIKRLPHGYDTVIHEDGSGLSQGQKQLICIARIMLCLPPMLILDEATSSIDTRTEIEIQKAFNALMQGRTSFVVAHRLRTIRDADLILVMNQGKVIETGTHEALLKANGFYARLYNSQFADQE